MKSQISLWSVIAALMVGGIACGYSPEANGRTAVKMPNPSWEGSRSLGELDVGAAERETNVCFQGYCLEGGMLSGEQRLALWSGHQAGAAAYGLTAEQAAARRQYEEIPLNSLFSSLPVIVRDGESLAFEMFGRTQPQEGEQDTAIETMGTYENYTVLQLTNLGAADDSIGGQRYRLEFEYFDNDQLNLVWVGQQRYCRRSTPPKWTYKGCP